jgi:hypothetical protein
MHAELSFMTLDGMLKLKSPKLNVCVKLCVKEEVSLVLCAYISFVLI